MNQGFDKPFDSTSRPPNTIAETRLSLVALHAKDTPSESPLWPQARSGDPGAPGPVHPARRSGGGGPCFRMRLPYCSPLGMSWGSTPQSSSQSTPLPGRRRRTQVHVRTYRKSVTRASEAGFGAISRKFHFLRKFQKMDPFFEKVSKNGPIF